MSSEGKASMDAREGAIFNQELSIEDLDAASGAGSDCNDIRVCGNLSEASCVQISERDIYGRNGFPNCAATVEDGSWCGYNDACVDLAVKYHGFKSNGWCTKAWR